MTWEELGIKIEMTGTQKQKEPKVGVMEVQLGVEVGVGFGKLA